MRKRKTQLKPLKGFMPQPSAICLKNVSFSYQNQKVLKNFDLSIPSGQIFCLVGGSGSGKTTALRLMNGLLTVDDGQVVLEGKAFTPTEGEKRRRQMGYVIQGSGLFPHMTLEENLCLIARREGWAPAKIKQRIHQLCELLDLPSKASFLGQKPRAISGGQQQRVGIARALFMRPSILLMDEPFSALDPVTRSELQAELVSLQKKLQLTIVLVTHDLPEAFSLADQMALLHSGQIEQLGRPSHFLTSPKTDYVKKFMKSHSPGALLKKIYLYSVMNTDIWVRQEDTQQKVLLIHLETQEQKSFSGMDAATQFLEQSGQDFMYEVSREKKFSRWGPLESQSILRETLASTENILDAMKRLLELKEDRLPVTNDQGELVGVFSREALNAL